MAAVFFDLGGVVELDAAKTGAFDGVGEGVAAEAEVGDVRGRAVEGAVFGVEIDGGEAAAGSEAGEESAQQRVDVDDVVDGHGGDDEIERAGGGRGFGGQVGLEGFDVADAEGAGLVFEDVEHAPREIGREDAVDEGGEREREGAGAAAEVEDGVGWGGCGAEADGREYVGRELATTGVVVPSGRALVEGLGIHGGRGEEGRKKTRRAEARREARGVDQAPSCQRT